jgi:hypothetical protein
VQANTGDLSTLWTRGGTNLGTDALEIRAYDGIGWSEWKTFDLVTRLPNRAPVVTPNDAISGVPIGETMAAIDLFLVSDADGDTPVQYEFWDGGANGGFFKVNGVAQPSGQPIPVSAANLGNALYQGGDAAGSETIFLRAHDGMAWSPWTSRQAATQRATNAAPVVHAPATKKAERSQWVRLSDFVSVTDADGDPMMAFIVHDMNEQSGSARLWAQGSYIPADIPTVVRTDNLADIWVQGGTELGGDAMEIWAQDSLGAWSNTFATFEFRTLLPNRAPVAIPAANPNGVGLGQTVAAGTLFWVDDPDGDSPTHYEFWDGGSEGGFFRVNGVAQPSGQTIPVSAANLANAVYQGGAALGSETLFVRVNDGTVWSDWTNWRMDSFAAPVRFTEIVGTMNADVDTVTEEDIVEFGLAGADTFNLTDGADAVLYGGSGDDTYNLAWNTSAFIYDTGGSPGDTLSIAVPVPLRATIDNRHLLLSDLTGDTGVVIADWQREGSRIESFNLGGTILTYDQLRALVSTAPNLAWEGVTLAAGMPETTAQVNEMLLFYARREAEIVAAQPGTVTITGGAGDGFFSASLTAGGNSGFLAPGT